MTPDAVVMDAEGAIAALGEITGETVTESVVTRIFSDFCVGKGRGDRMWKQCG